MRMAELLLLTDDDGWRARPMSLVLARKAAMYFICRALSG